MDGILLIDKPQGWTSHDVVAKTRGILRKAQREGLLGVSHLSAAQGSDEKRTNRTGRYDERVSQEADTAMHQEPAGMPAQHGQQGQAVRKIRVGHSGTLDPMAEGLLILLLGQATKQQVKFMKLDKSYEAEITLGATSDTDDAEGKIRSTEHGARIPTNQAIEEVLTEFTGEIDQVPPAYSAIKVDGQRAYKQARAGKSPVLKPRQVKIYDIELMAYKYPEIKIKAEVSSGTYIRSLARDIGQTLGTGGYLSRLARTRVGPYLRQNSIQITKLDAAALKKSIIAVR